MVMKRALDIANRRVENLLKENTKLIVSNETMRPKAEFFDELVNRNLLTSIRDTAKELQIKERVFVGWAGQQTLVTPKGRETFRLLMEGLKA